MTEILGVTFSEKSHREAVEHIDNILRVPQVKGVSHIITANPEIVMAARKRKGYLKLIKTADLVTPDGIGILLASKLLGGNIKERVAGFDLVTDIFQKREEEQNTLRVYFVGAEEEVVKRAARNIENTYKYIKVVGIHNGFFEKERENRILKEIHESQPDLVLVGLGSPRQDQFIHNNKQRIHAKVAIGVGGTFDVWSGKVQRAPMIFRNLGMEWFWRLITNPKRLFRQFALVKFALVVLKERLSFSK